MECTINPLILSITVVVTERPFQNKIKDKTKRFFLMCDEDSEALIRNNGRMVEKRLSTHLKKKTENPVK